MKRLALLLGTFMVLGVAIAPVLAQQSGQQEQAPSGQSTPANPSASSKPDVDIKGSVDIKSRPGDQPANRSGDQPALGERRGGDDGAALPRGAAGDRTTIFGLSPTAAVIVAAALLVVVILAIVAMTRSGETTYIDRDRRL